MKLTSDLKYKLHAHKQINGGKLETIYISGYNALGFA